MSTYTDASLIMFPSGYKEDKIYSLKPTDGAGDLTFTRASTATRVNSAGLIEKVRTNLVLQSNSFDTTWTLTGAVLTSGQAGYDGTTNAWLLDKNASQGRVTQSISQSGIQTLSVYAKKGTSEFLRMFVNGPNSSIYFNLNDGSVQSSTSIVSGKSTDVGGGWYRCEVAFDGTTTAVNIYPAESGSTAGTSGNILIQAAQLETGDIATDYIATTTAAVSVGPVANIPRIDYTGGGCGKLLLEPQRTNLVTFSEQFDNAYWNKGDVTITANTSDTIDPAGFNGADKIVETATTARHRVSAGSLTIAAVNYTASVFMKKGTARYGFVAFSGAAVSSIVVDLEDGTITDTSTAGTIVSQKVEDYGSGWYRISLTALGTAATAGFVLQFGSAGSATPSYQGNIPSFAGSTSNHLYAWGAQVEAGSYPTSYIPTLGAAVTRGADACSKTGISSLLGDTEGTWFLELDYKPISSSTNPTMFVNSLSSTIGIASSGVNTLRVRINAVNDIIATVNPTNRHKIAISFNASGVVCYVNGSSIALPNGASQVVSNLDTVNLETGTRHNDIDVYQMLYFQTRLSNAQLAEITA